MSRNTLRKMFHLDIIDELSKIPRLSPCEKKAFRASFLSWGQSPHNTPDLRHFANIVGFYYFSYKVYRRKHAVACWSHVSAIPATSVRISKRAHRACVIFIAEFLLCTIKRPISARDTKYDAIFFKTGFSVNHEWLATQQLLPFTVWMWPLTFIYPIFIFYFYKQQL